MNNFEKLKEREKEYREKIKQLKEQLKNKEQECDKYKKGFEEDFAFNNELINDKLQIGLEINRYKQALDDIENFLKTIMETNRVYPLQANLQKVLNIINKVKEQ